MLGLVCVAWLVRIYRALSAARVEHVTVEGGPGDCMLLAWGIGHQVAKVGEVLSESNASFVVVCCAALTGWFI